MKISLMIFIIITMLLNAKALEVIVTDYANSEYLIDYKYKCL